MTRTTRLLTSVLAALALTLPTTLVATLAAAPAQARAGVARPNDDPFYLPPGNLAGYAPGQVVRSRTVTVRSGGALPAGTTSTQVLYRTTDQLGQPAGAVATIVSPLVPKPGQLLSYQTFYDGLGDQCDPSYTLQNPDTSAGSGAVDASLLNSYVSQGYSVVTADYEELDRAFGAGQQSGYATLDGIRAAQSVLGLSVGGTRVGMLGYSGGSIATEYAAELASSYAPELRIVGAAAGGTPVHFAHTTSYIDGSPDWAGAVPAVLLGTSRGYHLSTARYASAFGRQIEAGVTDKCLDPKNPRVHIRDLFKPQYRDVFRVQTFARIFNRAIMGRTGTPRFPMLVGVGNHDGTGDGVMISRDAQELAYEYCRRGVPMQFRTYSGADHYAAIAPFESEAQSFLTQVLSGTTPADECAAITPGSSLQPLPELHESYLRTRVRHRAIFSFRVSDGSFRRLRVALRYRGHRVAHTRVRRVGPAPRRVVLRSHRRLPQGARVVLVVRQGRTLMDELPFTLR